jgi:hypothetical protein
MGTSIQEFDFRRHRSLPRYRPNSAKWPVYICGIECMRGHKQKIIRIVREVLSSTSHKKIPTLVVQFKQTSNPRVTTMSVL